MPSTDIDGSTIVILSEPEARRVYTVLASLLNAYYMAATDSEAPRIDPLDRKIVDKIARNLKPTPSE